MGGGCVEPKSLVNLVLLPAQYYNYENSAISGVRLQVFITQNYRAVN